MKAPRLGGTISSKDIADHLLKLAERVTKVRWKDRSGPSRQVLIGLVRTLDALVDCESQAIAFVNLMTDDGDDEAFVSVLNPTLGPHIGYELAGRLHNLAHRVSSMAAQLEHHLQHHSGGQADPTHADHHHETVRSLFGPPRGKKDPD